MRLCIITERFPKFESSAEYGYLRFLSKGLVKAGINVTVITAEDHTGPMVQEDEGITLHYLDGIAGISGLGSSFRESVLDRFEQLHIEKPFDLVHCADSAGLFIALNKKVLNTKVAAAVKAINLDEIFGILGFTEDTPASYLKTIFAISIKYLKSYFGAGRKLLTKADAVFVSSKQQQEVLERYYMIPEKKTYIIPFGIEIAPFFEPAQPGKLLAQLGVPPEYKIIFTVNPMYGAQELKNILTAFERVVVKKPNTALVVLGEGPKKFEIEAHMLNLALGSRVFFAGPITPNTLHELMSRCDFYINLNSKSSGFEPTVLEAMARGKTTIASEVGTSLNLIEHGVDGFLVRPTEVDILSRLLLDLISGHVDTRTLGLRAREKMMKMFDTRKMVDQTIEAYKKILGKR